MNRRDGAIGLALVGALLLLVAVVVAPSFQPAPGAAAAPTPAPTPAMGQVQGIVGHPSSITPLTARTQADRDLVALLFRGLVRLGPDNTILPDLATGWTVENKGARWTFHLRPDATWHDGTPVTSADVLYTVGVLQHPDYQGPLASGWAQVTARALDDHTVQFDLGNPVGGFLQAAAIPLLPAHILQDVPVAELADDPFASQPIGNGAFALVELSSDRAILEPVLAPVTSDEVPLQDPTTGATDPRTPRLARLELRFYDSATALADAFRAGEVDAAADLPAADAMALGSTPDARAIRYPGTTLTMLALNQDGARGPFADARTRRALVTAVDRASMIRDLLGGAGGQSATPIPPSSWAYDAKAAPLVPYNRATAVKGLTSAGWRRAAGNRGWIPPGASKPLSLKLLAPEASANPVANAAAQRVADAWTAIGLDTAVEALPPGEFVDRLRSGDYQAAVADVTIGLDPDLYPLLASTQVVEGGSNVVGIQDPQLDRALLAARAPGTDAARRGAFSQLQRQLASLQPMPTLFFRDTVMVANPTVEGPVPRPVADGSDRFWDVIRWRRSGR